MKLQQGRIHRAMIELCAMAAIVLVAQPNLCQGQATIGLASDALVHQAGLKVEWTSQAKVGADDSLVDWELFVDENKPSTTFEVSAGDRLELISASTRSPRGQIYGVEGARRQAETRQEIITAELKARGIKDVEVKIKKYQKPLSTIYLLTLRGEVTAIDADTGKNRWSVRVGDYRLPSIGLGVNANFVAVVNGSSVYCLDAATGKQFWSRACSYGVGSSPAVSDEMIVVPLYSGRLEVFPMENEGLDSFTLVSLAEGTSQPLVTESTISWTTTHGEMNVYMRSNPVRQISYRLRASDAITCSPTYKDGTLFAGSLDGYLYAVDELAGSTKWEVSLGNGISQSPAPIGESVYVISNDSKLFKFVAESGRAADGWQVPLSDVDRFAGAGANNVYVLDTNGNLLVIDRKTKNRLGSVRIGDVDLVLNNYQSDRLFLGTKHGSIQCLRELASRHPYFHADEVAEQEDVSKRDSNGGTATESNEENPFGSSEESDPFGASDDENPFGESDSQMDAESEESDDVDSDPFK